MIDERSRIFVSGGAGVIGSELIPMLYERGAKILVGDLKPRPDEWPVDILYRQGDLNECGKEELLFFEPDHYFHLAASFERTEEGPGFWESNERDNARLSSHLIGCLKDARSLKRVVFASSYLVYDPALYLSDTPSETSLRLAEGNKVNPRNLCGAAKLYHEKELEYLEKFFPLRSLSARIFRSFGRGSRDLISRWIRALLRGERIEVFGKENAFDFIYAKDAAEGILRLAETDYIGMVNLGSGRCRRIEDLVEILRAYFPEMDLAFKEFSGPFESSEADVERLSSLTGWRPLHRLEDAIPLLVDYERKRLAPVAHVEEVSTEGCQEDGDNNEASISEGH